MFELVAAWLTAVAAIATPVAHAPADAPVTAGRANLTVQQADAAVASTGKPAKADPTSWRWACDLPMTIQPAVGSGVTEAEIVEQLAYPVEYLRGLGYNVTVGEPVKYQRNAATSSTVGQVVVAVTKSRSEQPGLEGQAAYAHTNTSGRDALAATILVDANPKTGELAGDILLHELGHVLGLGHKAGTVMDVSWDAPIGFDAAEVAAVDCR
jgi:hypothetical protein